MSPPDGTVPRAEADPSRSSPPRRVGARPAGGDTSGDRWNLADLYPDDVSFRRARATLRERLPEVERHRDRLGQSAERLVRALDEVSELAKELGRLHAYASMRSDSDTRVAACQALREEVELLWTDFARRTSYVRPEILALAPEVLHGWLSSVPGLDPHRHFLEDLMRRRNRVLSPPEERLVAEAGLLRGGAHAVFNLLYNAELPRPEIALSTGETVTLTPSEFSKRRTTADREDRRRLFATYFSAYGRFRESLGQSLFQGLKEHVFYARVRGYDSCVEAALDPENVPTGVYRNLIRQVHAQLPVLHRYFRLRARALGLDRLEYHDLYCPLAGEAGESFDAGQARELVFGATEPLGGDYAAALRLAFEGRWIDWHPAPGKRAGAYANGAAYDVHPYVLLNFHGDYDSVSTLTHELGHALHSYFSNAGQPYPKAGYSIFVAEVASTFNEALLNHFMLERARSDEERLRLLGSYLDGVRGTLFRQTMFAEFELEIHDRAARDEALTGEILGRSYLDLLRRYHGHDDGVVRVADDYAVEWAAVPHFYYDFYVYQYATGIVAATALAEAVLEDRPGVRERYLEFLSAGGSDYPLELLRRAGVDLESPEPYDVTIRALNRKLDRLEALLDASPTSPATPADGPGRRKTRARQR